MADQGKTWLEAINTVLGEFRPVNGATPSWLTVPGSSRRLMLHRLYPELGIAFQFTDAQARVSGDGQEALLAELCRPVGVSLLFVDVAVTPSAPFFGELSAALEKTASRVARSRLAHEDKLALLAKIMAARSRCQQIPDGPGVAVATTDEPPVRPSLVTTPAAPAPPQRVRTGERWKQQVASNWRRFRGGWELFAQNRLALLGLGLIVLFGLMAIAHPILRATVWSAEIYNPKTGFDFLAAPHPSPPSWLPRPNNPYHQVSFTHLLGTDTLGHDVASLLLAATAPAFLIGVTAAFSTAIISVAIGALAAYFGGVVDSISMQVADVFLLLPAPLFMIIFGVLFQEVGPAGYGLIYGLVAGLGGAAIVMRSYALSLVNRPFIEASRVAGGGPGHIILRHIVPHMLPLAALYMMLSVVGAVVADGFISFFGFSRSYINWGSIIYTSFTIQAAVNSQVTWNVLVPASLALSFFAAAFYLVARGLHQVADPRLRGRG